MRVLPPAPAGGIEMMELTKERLQQIVHAAGLEPWDYEEVFDGITTGEIVMMARQLLAGLEQEPVAQVYQPANIGICAPLGPSVTMLKPLSAGTKLYAAPQLPQPAVTDEILRICQRLINRYVANKNTSSEFICCVTPERSSIGTGGVWDDWKALDEACRDTMLQGAESPSQSYKLRDGWVAVPVEPTAEMQSAAAGAIRFDTTPINKLWTGNAVYKAMIAAAPQQEVK